MRLAGLTLLVGAAAIASTLPGASQTALFDFDGQQLAAGQSLPLLLRVQGVTALFTSPAGSVFSLQSDATTHFRLSQFSGLYLYPNGTEATPLDIQFGQPLSAITLTFATADFQQVEVPTTLRLTAFQESVANLPVGSTTAHGAYAGDTMPMGTLSFTSTAPFNVVRLEIPPQTSSASGFLVDNIVATTVGAPRAGRIRRHLPRLGP